MSRILITGGSGFIGTNLVETMREAGHDVLSIDTSPPRIDRHRAIWKRVDLRDRQALHDSFARYAPDYVVHLGARTDLRGASTRDYDANTEGVANVVEAVNGRCAPRLSVFASSMLVCETGYTPKNDEDYNPTTPYGESKVAGERTIRSKVHVSRPWLILRPTSIWGPWFGSPYRDFFNAVRRGLYLHPSGRRIRRTYGYVQNCTYQIRQLCELETSALHGRTLYLADRHPIELRQWGDMIAQEFGRGPIREVPLTILRLLAKSGDALARVGVKSPPMTSFRLKNMLTEVIHDTSPLHQFCGAMPHSLDQGVKDTCCWIMDDGRQ